MQAIRHQAIEDVKQYLNENWMEGKMTIPDAFDAAQKMMRDKYKDPFLWAGFILVE